jgi:hypothetical protein
MSSSHFQQLKSTLDGVVEKLAAKGIQPIGLLLVAKARSPRRNPESRQTRALNSSPTAQWAIGPSGC